MHSFFSRRSLLYNLIGRKRVKVGYFLERNKQISRKKLSRVENFLQYRDKISRNLNLDFSETETFARKVKNRENCLSFYQ